MKKIMFVCTGNTCRSPMAEAIAKTLWGDKAEVISRGFGASGQRISKNAQEVLAVRGIDFANHYSVTVSEKELIESDLVLTMTEGHKIEILRVLPQLKNKVFTLCEYTDTEGDIPDPYMSGLEEYNACCEKIEACIKKIDIEKIAN